MPSPEPSRRSLSGNRKERKTQSVQQWLVGTVGGRYPTVLVGTGEQWLVGGGTVVSRYPTRCGTVGAKFHLRLVSVVSSSAQKSFGPFGTTRISVQDSCEH